MQRLRFRCSGTIWLAGLSLWLGMAQAIGSSMGPLTSIIQPGAQGPWHVSAGQQGVQLQNQQQPGDLTYYYVNEEPGQSGQRVVSVKVQLLNASANAGAGLLYAYRDNPRSYYLFTLAADGTVSLSFRGANGFETRQATTLPQLAGQSAQLKIVEQGTSIALWVNEQKIGTIGESGMGRGALGIVAADLGTFRFSDFSIAAQQRGAAQSRGVAPSNGYRQVSSARSAKPSGATQMHDYLDPKMGMVQRRVPLPSGWQLDTNPNDLVTLIGPRGILGYYKESGRFFDSPDPNMQQSARMSGTNVAPVKSVSAYLREEYAPYMQQSGYRLTDQFPMPQVQVFWERFGAAMPQGLSRKRYEALGASWTGGDGSKAFTILVLNVLQRPNMVTWHVGASEVYAAAEDFAHAQQTLIHVARKTEMNPQWQIAMNRQLIENIRRDGRIADERLRQSQVAHAQRMNSILARGESSRQIAKINSDILDSSHSSYLKRSDMVTAGDQRFTRMTHEQAIIKNDTTGEMYEVDAGYKRHWVSADGVHMGTDNLLYDPRTDRQVNQMNWSSFEEVN